MWSAGSVTPFRDAEKRKQFDQCLSMYRTRHKNYFHNGEPHTANSFAAAFWVGYRGISSGLYGYAKGDRETGSYVSYRAGQLIRSAERAAETEFLPPD